MIASHITRRGFLKRATAAIGIIAVSHGIVLAPDAGNAATFTLNVNGAGAKTMRPVSYMFLEENYQRFMYGACEPTLILTSIADWMATRNLIAELSARHGHLVYSSGRHASFVFNGADVAFSSKVPEGEFWFINERYPTHPYYSGKAYL